LAEVSSFKVGGLTSTLVSLDSSFFGASVFLTGLSFFLDSDSSSSFSKSSP
jgi:hypothetical protein